MLFIIPVIIEVHGHRFEIYTLVSKIHENVDLVLGIKTNPKDKDTILKKGGVIYKYSCERVDCGEEYIWESGRTFGERYREHMRSPSPIMDHYNTTGHEVSLDNFTVVGREDNNIARNIKEAIFIRVNDPSLNRNIGKFQLSHIWDEVLARSPELHLK